MLFISLIYSELVQTAAKPRGPFVRTLRATGAKNVGLARLRNGLKTGPYIKSQHEPLGVVSTPFMCLQTCTCCVPHSQPDLSNLVRPVRTPLPHTRNQVYCSSERLKLGMGVAGIGLGISVADDFHADFLGHSSVEHHRIEGAPEMSRCCSIGSLFLRYGHGDQIRRDAFLVCLNRGTDHNGILGIGFMNSAALVA
jgi:hypothetical protein